MKTAEIDSETERLEALIAEDIASGICDKEPEAIIEEIIAKRRARNGERDILCRSQQF